MQISIASILASAAIAASVVSAAAPQGKVFNHYLQIWLENQVSASLREIGGKNYRALIEGLSLI